MKIIGQVFALTLFAMVGAADGQYQQSSYQTWSWNKQSQLHTVSAWQALQSIQPWFSELQLSEEANRVFQDSKSKITAYLTSDNIDEFVNRLATSHQLVFDIEKQTFRHQTEKPDVKTSSFTAYAQENSLEQLVQIPQLNAPAWSAFMNLRMTYRLDIRVPPMAEMQPWIKTGNNQPEPKGWPNEVFAFPSLTNGGWIDKNVRPPTFVSFPTGITVRQAIERVAKQLDMKVVEHDTFIEICEKR